MSATATSFPPTATDQLEADLTSLLTPANTLDLSRLAILGLNTLFAVANVPGFQLT